MSVEFFTKEGISYTPIHKSAYAESPTTTFIVWSPTSGKKIVLTDVQFSCANAGTIRVYFYGTKQTMLVESLIGGSAAISLTYETPIVSDESDAQLRIVTGMNGLVYVNTSGFEI